MPTAGAIANAIAKVIGTQVRRLPMTPERVWAASRDGAPMSASFTSAATVEDALAALAAGARPVAGGTDLVVGARQGKAPLPDAIVAIDRIDGARAAIDEAGGGLRLGALVDPRRLVASDDDPRRGSRRSPTPRRSSARTRRARTGTIGGNVMNASPAMDTGGAAALLRRDGRRSGRPTASGRSRSTSSGPARARPSADPGELLVGDRAAGAGRRAPARAYVRLEYRRQMEIAVVGATAVVTRRRRRDRRRPRRDHGARADDPAGRRGRSARSSAPTAARTRSRRRPPRRPRRRRPISDVRASADYRRAMAEVIARRAITAALARARGGDVPIPASAALYGA